MANLREHIRQSNAYKWWILGMIMLGTFMAVLDVTVVNVGLPAIMSAFGIGISSAEWVITAYMITMTIMLPSAGWFADRFGNKRVYMLGLALFTLGSWLCGKASSDPFLIGARALQGVGSGIIQALGLAIVTREFKPAERGLALGLWSMAAAASISFGPLLGGYLVDAYSWHKIFDVNVPVGVLAVLLAAFVQKEWKNQTRSPFDWQGFAAIVLFMPLAIYALARGNSPSNPGGWSAPEVIGCFIVAGAALAWFIVAELRNPAPLLQIRLLAERNFGISMAVLTLFAIGMLGGTYLLPLYMQRGLGYTALAAGSMFLPVGVIQGVLSAVSGYLTRYVRPLLLSAAGILIMALSFWLASRFTLHTRTYSLHTLSARLRHGTYVRAAQPLLAQEPHPAGHGRGGRHFEQHQTAGRKHRNRPPDGDLLGANLLPRRTRDRLRGADLRRRGHGRPARGGGHHAGGVASAAGGLPEKTAGKERSERCGNPFAGRGRLRQNRQDNHLPDKTRIGRRPPDTNKTPAPGEGCRRIRMPGRVIPAPCVCGRRA